MRKSLFLVKRKVDVSGILLGECRNKKVKSLKDLLILDERENNEVLVFPKYVGLYFPELRALYW